MNPTSKAPDISVMTVTYNGRRYLPGLFAALAEQQVDITWEYVVVDNGSSDGTADFARELARDFPVPVTVVDGSAHPGNIPFVRNLAAATARADYLVYCDQDDIVQPGWVQAAYEGLSQHDAVMGLIRELREDVHAGGSGAARGRGGQESSIMNPSVYTELPVVESCNFGVRRAALVSVGGFDEELAGYGMDDSELAVRLRRAGYTIVGFPQMVIHARGTASAWGRIRKVFSSAQTEVLVWSKHSDVFPGRLTWRYFVRETAESLRVGVPAVLGRGAISPGAGGRRIIASAAHAKALAARSLSRRRNRSWR